MNAVLATDAIVVEQFEPYRRELVGYCYRMLGSIHDAHDAVQDVMLRGWRAFDRFEDRAGIRPWLYRIATNVCLDMLQGRARRALPMSAAPVGASDAQLVDRHPDETWIGPAPDALVLRAHGDPADHIVSRESVRLAFVAALQYLTPRQRAILVLRDVLGWHAGEVATLLETSVHAVNSTLRRARSALKFADRDTTPTTPPSENSELLLAYIDAFNRHDVAALVGLLRDDAIVEMPPFDLWLHGIDDIREWLTTSNALANHVLVPVEANGSLAVAVYLPQTEGGEPHAFAIHVLDVIDGQISVIHSFIDATLFQYFGLPARATSARFGSSQGRS